MQLGSPAPEFALTATNGQQIRLADLRGSYVVLVFYPANDTPTCNKQLDEMNIDLEQFLTNNTRVFGVNTGAVEAHRGYCERRRLQFPILSDAGGKVAKLYGASFPVVPLIRRTVVAIDPQGSVCFYQHGKPDPEVVLESIKRSRNESTAIQ